jgi:hypothetical protein
MALFLCHTMAALASLLPCQARTDAMARRGCSPRPAGPIPPPLPQPWLTRHGRPRAIFTLSLSIIYLYWELYPYSYSSSHLSTFRLADWYGHSYFRSIGSMSPSAERWVEIGSWWSGFFNLTKKSRLEVDFGNSWRCSSYLSGRVTFIMKPRYSFDIGIWFVARVITGLTWPMMRKSFSSS